MEISIAFLKNLCVELLDRQAEKLIVNNDLYRTLFYEEDKIETVVGSLCENAECFKKLKEKWGIAVNVDLPNFAAFFLYLAYAKNAAYNPEEPSCRISFRDLKKSGSLIFNRCLEEFGDIIHVDDKGYKVISLKDSFDIYNIDPIISKRSLEADYLLLKQSETLDENGYWCLYNVLNYTAQNLKF